MCLECPLTRISPGKTWLDKIVVLLRLQIQKNSCRIFKIIALLYIIVCLRELLSVLTKFLGGDFKYEIHFHSLPLVFEI